MEKSKKSNLITAIVFGLLTLGIIIMGIYFYFGNLGFNPELHPDVAANRSVGTFGLFVAGVSSLFFFITALFAYKNKKLFGFDAAEFMKNA